uniref:Uncharacterized protein n=1 Tax=Triticum urartu TaxID=4572 RepID=A0A8R7QRE0_TRIUA
ATSPPPPPNSTGSRSNHCDARRSAPLPATPTQIGRSSPSSSGCICYQKFITIVEEHLLSKVACEARTKLFAILLPWQPTKTSHQMSSGNWLKN